MESVKHCTDSLRRLLSPNYAVLNVDSSTILSEPWQEHTSLLVFPGGADLPFCREFNGKGNQLISSFVHNGGRYIGFCAGGYYACGTVEFEIGNKNMEVQGPRELKFFPGIARGCVFEGFQYGSHTSAVDACVSLNVKALNPEGVSDFPSSFKTYVNGGCLFVDADDYADQGVEVLARYTDELVVEGSNKQDTKAPAAALYCKVGNGCAVVTGIHPEMSPELLRRIPKHEKYTKMIKNLTSDDASRATFMKAMLKKMGLKVNKASRPIPSLSRLHLTSSYPPRLIYLIENLKKELAFSDETNFKDSCDTFSFCDSQAKRFSSNEALNGKKNGVSNGTQATNEEDCNDNGYFNYDNVIKEVDVYSSGLPANRITSFFNHELYYNSLRQFQHERYGGLDELGTVLLYGEVVTSTSTLLYKNHNLLRLLPHGFSAVGTIQVAGRGRGNNVWVNPQGVLAVSTVLRMPLSDSYGRPFPVVFTQYVVSLAMVEAIKHYGRGYDSVPIRLKWPNDIYCENPEYNSEHPQQNVPEFLKVGGLLVNTNISDGEYVLVAGLGINVYNEAPSTSINAILTKLNHGTRFTRRLIPLKPFLIETLLAKFLVTLESMLAEFKYQGFAPFEQAYYKYWLHSNKIVVLEQYDNIRAMIKGISLENGLLIVQEVDENDAPIGNVYELQPDGNLFDMMKGLLKKKT